MSRGGRGGRGGARGGRNGNMPANWDFAEAIDGRPSELFPPYRVLGAAPLTAYEEASVAALLGWRDEARAAPTYLARAGGHLDPLNPQKTYGQAQRNALYADARSRAHVDPFTAMEMYSHAFTPGGDVRRDGPDFAAMTLFKDSFPAELLDIIEGRAGVSRKRMAKEGAGRGSRGKRGGTRGAGGSSMEAALRKLANGGRSDSESEDEGDPAAAARRKKARLAAAALGAEGEEGEGAGDDGLGDDDAQDEVEIDEVYDDEDAGDYDAEAYYDDGAGDDDDYGGGGGDDGDGGTY